MTRATLKTLILSWLDDPNSTYFTDANLNVWLNTAQRQVQMMLLQAGENYYMRPVETQTVVGQADYLWPSDFMVEHRIEVVVSGTGVNENRKPLGFITTNQQDLTPISSGTPANYYIKKDRFTVLPTPDQALTMRLYYSPMVQDMTSDTDSPDVPEQYMEAVAMMAAYNGFVKDDRAPQNLVMKKAEFEKMLKEMSEDRTQDRSRQVVMTTDYDAYTWL